MAQIKFLIIVLFSITIQSQEFDFSCATELEGYVSDWFDDAETNGMVYQRNGIIDWVSNSTRTFDPTIQFSGVSVNSCLDGYEIYVNESWWNQISLARRKALIYHEMGHAVLEYDHVCNNELPFNLHPQPGGTVTCLTNTPTRPFNLIWRDIMWSSENCSTDVCTLINIDRQRYERYWNKTDYIPIQCGANKGIDIIYD